MFRKTNIFSPLIRRRTCACAYQGVRNVTFGEKFAYVQIGSPLEGKHKICKCIQLCCCNFIGISTKFTLQYKVGNITFWKILNVAICYIFIGLNINLNIIKGIRDTKNYWNCKFQEAEPEWTWIFFSQTFLQKTYRDEFTKLSKVGLSWKV